MALFVVHITLENFLGLGFKETLELRKLPESKIGLEKWKAFVGLSSRRTFCESLCLFSKTAKFQILCVCVFPSPCCGFLLLF
jgi:hypothetical protein